MRRRRQANFVVAATIAGMFALSQPSPAQESPDALREHVREAVEAVKNEEFSEAARHYMEAYDISPKPMLLYNAAYAYGRAGRLKSALDASSRARREGLDDESYAARNRARHEGWRAAVRARSLAEGVNLRVPRKAASGPDAPGANGFTPLRWVGIGSAAAGSGLLVGALVFDRQIAKETDALREAKRDQDRQAYDASLQEIEADQTRGRVLFIAGSALVAGGATLFVVDLLDEPKETNVSVVPYAHGTSGVGVTVETAF